MYKKILSLALALVIVMSMALTGCAEKTTETENSGTEPSTTEDSTGNSTATTREDVGKLVNDFYAGLEETNPIHIDTLSQGELVSTFDRDGDKICSSYPSENFAYYGFIEDGVKYYMSDGETAYADDSMYDMINDGLSTSLQLFVTGFFSDDAEFTEDGESYTYSAEQTDNKLTYTVEGVVDGTAEKITVTGTKDADGRITNIVFDRVAGEEGGNMEMKFSYDNISVEVPEYTIGTSGASAVVGETSHVDSPYATVQELIDTLEEDHSLFYVIQDECVYAFGEKDGRYYQFRASFPAEKQEEYDALDYMADDFAEKQDAIIGALVIDDCVDFTDCVESPDVLAGYVGMTIGEMVEAGFEGSGWGIGGGEGNVSLTKNLMTYTASITIPEGLDEASVEDFEELYDCVIESIAFEEPEYVAFPID